MKIFVTGSAGFIGYHLVSKLLSLGHEVIGLDNINDYYDVEIKFARLNLTGIKREEIKEGRLINSVTYSNYKFIKLNLEDKDLILDLFSTQKFDVVVNLAAQAGVRYSIKNPYSYTSSNIVGFMNILEGARHNQVSNLIYASTSSVYGLNTSSPLNTHESANHPMTLYAASKKANEMMAHSYSHLYNLPTTGLRFFTVYGPWGRPDMALFLFTKAILNGEKLNVFNYGKMIRDFTYVDDIVESISRLCLKPATPNPNWNSQCPDPATSSSPYKIFNIGNSNPVKLINYIETIEEILGKKAELNFLPMQMGDVPENHADVNDLINEINFKPNTTIKHGVNEFVKWYIDFYKISNFNLK